MMGRPEGDWRKRLMDAVVLDEATGCWHATKRVGVDGYARVYRRGHYVMSHRAAYELFVGPIADGLTVDHLCHNDDESCLGGTSCMHRRCVNHAHLGLATMRENTLRGKTLAAANAAKTHCPRGHAYAEGTRVCRICERARCRRDYHERRKLVAR